MSTVYLDRKDLSIAVEGARLTVHPAAHGRGTIPLQLISRLVLNGRINLDSATLASLADRGIPVICLGGRSQRRMAQVSGPAGKDVLRRINQFRLSQDEGGCLTIARTLVDAKLRTCQRELAGLLLRRPALRRPIQAGSGTIGELRRQVRNADLDHLRGLEGAGAAAWFRVLASALPDSLDFAGRNRRPPRDPANAVLSLAYTLAHAEAVAACHGHGLDPMLGFFHAPDHGRESLACDLIEPLRPRIDIRVLKLFSSQDLDSGHFSTTTAGCRLKKSGRAIFYSWWEAGAPPLRRYFRIRGHEFVRQLAEYAQ